MFKTIAILIASLITIHVHAVSLHSSGLRGQGNSDPTMEMHGSDAGKTGNLDMNDPKVVQISHEDTPFLTNINLPQEENVDVTNIDPNTDNMVAPKNECNVCQKFFNQIVFPKLAMGTPACQPKHMKAMPKSGDGPALMGYCQLYNEKLHDDNRGGLELMIKDMVEQHGADLGKCAAPLAFDSCVDLGKCTETPCDICQDKVHRASTFALNNDYDGMLKLGEHLESMCNDASNPEIVQLRKQLIDRAEQRAKHLEKYQSGHDLFSPKKIDAAEALEQGITHMVEHKYCKTLSSVDNVERELKDANIEWGKEKAEPKNIKRYCEMAGFCRAIDNLKQPSKCEMLEESRDAEGKVHEGATEKWVDHDVAKILTYEYRARVTQKGQQTTMHAGDKDKAEEKKDTWVTAEVVIRNSVRKDLVGT